MDHLHAEKAVAALGRRHIGVGYLSGDSGESGARPGFRIGFEAAALPEHGVPHMIVARHGAQMGELDRQEPPHHLAEMAEEGAAAILVLEHVGNDRDRDRKSTRLNSSPSCASSMPSSAC